MKNVKFWIIGVLVTFLIVHIASFVACKLTGGNINTVVVLAEVIASFLIFITIRKDFTQK